jgi:hypothetical protein
MEGNPLEQNNARVLQKIYLHFALQLVNYQLLHED